MLSTPHVAVATAIAVSVSDPLVSIPVVVASHFLLDMIPHWNPHLNHDLTKNGKITNNNFKIVFFDTFLALALGLFVAFSFYPDIDRSLIIIATCFFAVLPDLVEAPHYFLGKQNKMISRYIKWQKSIQNDVSPVLGLLVQITVILVALWVVFGQTPTLSI